jgi:hypothetical protein
MRRDILTFFKFKFIFLLILFFTETLLAGGIKVKSLRVFGSHDQRSFPIIEYSDKSKSTITIDFDVESETYPSFIILFKFCDADGKPYDNPFLQNPIYNSERNLMFDNLPSNVRGAQYHYTCKFPNSNVQFPFSGKWCFEIVDIQNNHMVFGTGKFFVVYPEAKLDVQFAKETQEGSTSPLVSLDRTISIRTDFTLPDSLFNTNVRKVELVNNRKLDYPVVIDRMAVTADKFFEWNASNKFSFIVRNIKPGNYYRETDTRDYNVYNSSKVDAKFGNIETSNFFTKTRKDMNGGTELMDYRNSYADYLNVAFKLRAPENIKVPIFLVGSFTGWKVLPEFEMYDDNGLMNISVELKRGAYDYQYVTGQVVNDNVENIDWQILEGNFWETENEYYIFLYYQTVEKGGYDKIIGYKKITTGAL